MKVSRKEVEGKVYCDKFSCKADGTVAFYRGYFYRHGQSSDSFAKEVAGRMGPSWVVVDHEDQWRAWPKDSYFVVTARKRQPAENGSG